MLSVDRINELEKENEKLKERIIKIDHSHKNRIYELEDILQQIKEIAEDAYKNDSEYQATGIYAEILDLINQAEEE